MKTRIIIASGIYKDLIFLDLQASTKNPMVNAQRALLFADALLVCDATTRQDSPEECSFEVAVQTQGRDTDQAILIRAAKAKFASDLENRRGRGHSSVN